MKDKNRFAWGSSDIIATEEEDAKKSVSILKTDDDKRLVFGWASVSITVDGEQLEDRQKDMIDPEDLEEAAYEYVLNFRDTGEEHISSMRKKGKLVESVVFTEEKQRAMGIPPGTLPVAWWIGFKIEDDAAWERVKNGTYKMFSIEGKANRIPVEKSRRDYDEYPEYGMWLEENLDATIEEQRAAERFYDDNKKKPITKGRLKGCGVLVVQDGKILSGTRIERGGRGQICGPGGHIEAGEAPEDAAKREAWEEFGITCEDLISLGTLKDGTSAIFLCTEFSGTPKTDEEEMTDLKWRTIEELRKENLFGPFEASLEKLPPTKRHGVAKTFYDVMKENPYHDALGRFTTAGGSVGVLVAPNNPTNDPETIAGVKRGEPMTHEQADAGRANPGYSKPDEIEEKLNELNKKMLSAIDRKAPAEERQQIASEMDRYCQEYEKAYAESRACRINCQTCVLAYEARLRGYDVEATPRTKKNAAQEDLYRHVENAWIDPATGKPPIVVRNDPSINKTNQIKAWMNQNVEEGARYVLGHGWKGTAGNNGHDVIVMKDSSKKILIFDPQNGKTYAGDAADEYMGKIKATYNNGSKTVGRLELIRVDNMQINSGVANAVLKGAGQ